MLRDQNLVPLSHQHHNGLALCVLTERSLQRDSSPGNTAKLAHRVVDRYVIELVNHFDMEEQILFPAVKKHLGESPLVDELVNDHRTLADLVMRLRVAPSIPMLEEFVRLLRTHIRREENELFEDIQRRLPPEVLNSLGEQIEARAARVCL